MLNDCLTGKQEIEATNEYIERKNKEGNEVLKKKQIFILENKIENLEIDNRDLKRIIKKYEQDFINLTKENKKLRHEPASFYRKLGKVCEYIEDIKSKGLNDYKGVTYQTYCEFDKLSIYIKKIFDED